MCSATACGEYAGTRTTVIPYSAAAARSTWLKPAERKREKPHPELGEILDHLPVHEIVHEYTDRGRSRGE